MPEQHGSSTLDVAAIPPLEPEKPPTRGELAGLPAVAGNDTFGLMLGVTGSYTRYAEGFAPFRFRAQLAAITSIKDTDEGLRSPLQNIDLRLDFPGLLHGRVRIYALLRYQRIRNVGYWGLGNGASGRIPADYQGPRDRFFTYEKRLAEARLFVRGRVARYVDLVAGAGFRYLAPNVVEGSRLERDVAARDLHHDLVYGYTRQMLFDALFGVLVDTRDHEFNPTRGSYHELSLRGGLGPSDDRFLHYFSLYLHTRWFFPLLDEWMVLGLRALGDLGGGAMPLIELGTVGGYTSMPGPASIEANRGLPYGRQLGRVKLLSTVELRSTFHHFTLFKHQFALGAALFTDASRVWAHLSGKHDLDGGPILRFSFGGGPRLTWGDTLVIRLDAGFSPRAGIDGAHNVSASLALGQVF